MDIGIIEIRVSPERSRYLKCNNSTKVLGNFFNEALCESKPLTYFAFYSGRYEQSREVDICHVFNVPLVSLMNT